MSLNIECCSHDCILVSSFFKFFACRPHVFFFTIETCMFTEIFNKQKLNRKTASKQTNKKQDKHVGPHRIQPFVSQIMHKFAKTWFTMQNGKTSLRFTPFQTIDFSQIKI